MQRYFFFIYKGEVTRVSILGKAFLALIIMPLALTTYFRCIEDLKCVQAQEGDDDAFEEHLHLYYQCYQKICLLTEITAKTFIRN